MADEDDAAYEVEAARSNSTTQMKIDFQVGFNGPEPSGVKFLVNDEIAAAPSLHPSETEWKVEPGELTLQIIVEGPASSDEMEKLTSRDPEKMANVKETERINATWNIVVADPDELYQSDSNVSRN